MLHQSVALPERLSALQSNTASVGVRGTLAIIPQQALGQSCASCGDAVVPSADGAETLTQSYIYAIGKIQVRFPSLDIEKEYRQASGRTDTSGLTDAATLQAVLSDRSNRYLARQLCYVMTIADLETYLITPRDPSDFDLLLDAIRERPSETDKDVIIGIRGPIAPPEACNGLQLPIVVFDQMYSFDTDTFLKSIPRPETFDADRFGGAAAEMFSRIISLVDNAGATDEHRALNYLAVRYPGIYALATEANDQNKSLTAIEVRPSRLSGTRKIVDVIFAFTHRQTDVTEKYVARVDVTGEFPFLVTKLSPYIES